MDHPACLRGRFVGESNSCLIFGLHLRTSFRPGPAVPGGRLKAPPTPHAMSSKLVAITPLVLEPALLVARSRNRTVRERRFDDIGASTFSPIEAITVKHEFAGPQPIARVFKSLPSIRFPAASGDRVHRTLENDRRNSDQHQRCG